MSNTPYGQQSEQHFWRTAVANISLGDSLFEQLSAIKLAHENPNIASAGSCFAQHVGNWLLEQNYAFQQSQLDTTHTSSFAFGNIYTPRCLLQWFDVETLSGELTIHEEKGRYFDLLRPNFQPKGFQSLKKLKKARVKACNELKATLRKTDIFIFTLGLTESWKDKNAIFYPSCPGVIVGQFDAENYQFYNFSYAEIKADLEKMAKILRQINPELQILLTVSPVPLTATATDKHVLVANQYSKSVLRTVAGELADNQNIFHYFPSYEIITAPNAGDFRFQTNRRTVTPDAVAYVMQHFAKLLPHKVQNKAQPTGSVNEAVCDEEFLETTKSLADLKPSNDKYNLTLIGDSHMSKLSTALKKMGVAHSGGMVMNGSGFAQKKFALCPEEYFVPLENAQSRQLWSRIYANLKRHETDKTTEQSIIITNIGLQTHQTIAGEGGFHQWFQNHPNKTGTVSQLNDFIEYLNAMQKQALSILYRLHQAGHTVIVVSDPPFSKHFNESKSIAPLIYAYFTATEIIWKQHGIQFFNAATTFDEEIKDMSAYAANVVFEGGYYDWYHGNERYYEWLAEKLNTVFNLKTTVNTNK